MGETAWEGHLLTTILIENSGGGFFRELDAEDVARSLVEAARRNNERF